MLIFDIILIMETEETEQQKIERYVSHWVESSDEWLENKSMDKRKIDPAVLKSVNEYLGIVNQHYRIDVAYLFGSYAKGNTHKWSDIDLAIVSDDIKERLDDMAKMFVLAADIDGLIEPHPYNTKEFRSGDYMLANEILRTGIPVWGNPAVPL